MDRKGGSTRPKPHQREAALAVVRWYFRWHFRSDEEPGTISMFASERLLGAVATPARRVIRNEQQALFRVLVATAMFQRQRDEQVKRILRGLPQREAAAMLNSAALLRASQQSPCKHLRNLAALHEECDLAKVGSTPTCRANPRAACPLKKHARLLRRYGDFGKIPTSAALVAHAEGSLPALRKRILRDVADPLERARQLEAAVARVWRIGTKLATMFLSCVANPDLSPGAPWADGLDWSHFVVIDSNVDAFLASIGYAGANDYDGKRAFLRALAKGIDLCALDPRVRHSFNPRLVQQAMFLFMSADNRRVARADCYRLGHPTCNACPLALSRRCPLRQPPPDATDRTRHRDTPEDVGSGSRTASAVELRGA